MSNDLDDFQKKYPPDPVIGTEMNEDARVWKVFRDEASAYDTRMLDLWNKSLDVHLVFAGLFSAVVTPFVMESATRLEPDDDDDETFVVDRLTFWVNLLWFTSLALALAAAFIAILCKQWIAEYSLRTAPSSDYARQWARRRQLNSDGLSTWALPDVIAILPALLHLALLLFLGGLLGRLWGLHFLLALWITFVSSTIFSWYFIMTAYSIFDSKSPFATPMLRLARTSGRAVLLRGFRRICRACLFVLHSVTFVNGGNPGTHARVSDALRRGIAKCDIVIRQTIRQRRVDVQRMDAAIDRRKDSLDASALDWLISVSDRNAAAVAIQAIGALSPASRTAWCLLSADGYLPPGEAEEIFQFERAASPTPSNLTSNDLVRISRSLLCACRLSRDSLPPNTLQVLKSSTCPEARLLSGWIESELPELTTTDVSPTLTSTFMLLLNSDRKNLRLLMLCLLSCELANFDRNDWRTIFRSLRACAGPDEYGDLVHNLHYLPDMLLNVADVAAEFAPVAKKLIHWCIQQTLPGDPPFQPRLVQYMTRITFLDSAPEGFDSTTLARRLLLMSERKHLVPARYLPDMLRAILSVHRVRCDVRDIIRACTNVLAFKRGGDHVNPVAMKDRSRSKTPSDAPGPAMTPFNDVVDALLPLLKIVLCESYARDDVAFWTMLHEDGSVWALYPKEMCTLAAVLASALCAVSRIYKPTDWDDPDDPMKDLAKAFSRGRSCLDLLRSGVLVEADRDNVTSLVRHCVELEQPVQTYIQHLRSESGSNGASSQAPLGEPSFVSDILKAVNKAGPCKKCRGDPVGWGNRPGGMTHNCCA